MGGDLIFRSFLRIASLPDNVTRWNGGVIKLMDQMVGDANTTFRSLKRRFQVGEPARKRCQKQYRFFGFVWRREL